VVPFGNFKWKEKKASINKEAPIKKGGETESHKNLVREEYLA